MKICAYEAIYALREFVETMSLEPQDMVEFLEKKFNIDLELDVESNSLTLEDVMHKFVVNFVG